MISKLTKILKLAYSGWNEDRAPRLGAALAYYTVFSLAPLLIICIGIAGLIFDKSQARGAIIEQMTQTLGASASKTIGDMLDSANNRQGSGPLAIVIGSVTALAGAAGLFGQLQDALNTIWGVKLKPLPFLETLRVRFISFAMVFGIAFLLLVSLALSAGIAAATKYLNLSDGWVGQASNTGISFVVTTLLFAFIFKILPDAEIQWRDVWIGSLITSFLFTVGKFGLGIYLGRSSATSIYGSAASLVLILLWVYYAAQILFAGAEITKSYANLYGSKIKPSPDAEAVTSEARAEQGMEPLPTSPGARPHGENNKSGSGAASDREDSDTGTAPTLPPRGRALGRGDEIASVVLGLGLAYFLYRWRARRQVMRQVATDEDES